MTPCRRTDSHPLTPTTRRDHADRLLAAALAAAGRDWRVFPLRPDAKRPAFPDHTADRCAGTDPRCRDGHTGWEPRATTDPERIRQIGRASCRERV